MNSLLPQLGLTTKFWVYLTLGKEVTLNSSGAVSVRSRDEAPINAATTRAGLRPLVSSFSPSPNPSPLSSLLDVDAFSVISDLSDKSPIPEEPSDATLCDDSVTHVSTNPTTYLTSLVEHGIGLCVARRALEEEVLKRLETKEKSYLVAVESAKNSLAMTRRDAVDIVKRLKVASGGIINIILPWHSEVEKEGYDPEKKPCTPTASSSTLIPAMLISACPEHVPVPTIVAPRSILIPTSPTLVPCAMNMVEHSIETAPLIHTSVSPSSLLVTPSPEPTLRTSLPRTACSTSTINPPVPATPPAVPPPNPNMQEHQEHQELLQRYEERMSTAKGIGCSTISRSMVPWPVLVSPFPLRSTDPSLGATTLEGNLQDFIDSYSQWKHLSFEETSTIMLNDWVLILSKVEKKYSRTRETIDRVIRQLRAFSNNTISVAN